jgi:CHASE3 domain sensor protein
MDLNSAEDSISLKVAAAFAAAIICLGIGFGFALNRSLGQVGNSLTRGFVLVEHADELVDELDRLSIDQRALLSIGGDRYAEGVAESVTGMITEVNALEQLHVRDQDLERQITRLSNSVDWVLSLIGQTNDLQQSFGTEVALAVLDSDGDNSILAAKMDAMELKRLATDRVLYRVRIDRKLRSVLEVVF